MRFRIRDEDDFYCVPIRSFPLGNLGYFQDQQQLLVKDKAREVRFRIRDDGPIDGGMEMHRIQITIAE